MTLSKNNLSSKPNLFNTMNKFGFCFIFTLLAITSVYSQNLLANGSFENVVKIPALFADDTHYKMVEVAFDDWQPICVSSYYVHQSYENTPIRKGLKLDVKPRSGESMVALVYSGQAKNELKSAVYTPLSQPLEKNKEYYFEFYVANSLYSGYAKSGLGVQLFDTLAANPYATCELWHELRTSAAKFLSSNLVGQQVGQWTKISGTFLSDKAYKYFAIGIFLDNKDVQRGKTRTRIPEKYVLDKAIYYIDDVILREKKKEDIVQNTHSLPSIPSFQSVYFAADSWSIDKAKYEKQLENLAFYLKQKTKVTIELCGTSDFHLQDDYNKQLAEKRCQSIQHFLLKKGVPSSQILITLCKKQQKVRERRVDMRVIKNK